jgi:hypothetical protein
VSQEVQIAFPCPHLVIEEGVDLGSDRKSLATRAPIANTNLVRILANDQFYVPSTGLFSQAVLVGDTAGPFQIFRCKNLYGPLGNQLLIKASAGEVLVFLPEGERVSSSEVEKSIRKQASDYVEVGTRNGAVVLADINQVGRGSFVQVSGQGAEQLGFTLQLGARGDEIYPPWGLEAAPQVYPTLKNARTIPTRYPKFKKALRNNPDLKVTYAAVPEFCPRCRATYIENDWRFDEEGDTLLIDNENLLYQACLKALLTRKGSNSYHPAYGSSIMDRIGSKVVGATLTLLQEDVRAALLKVQTVQSAQRKYQLVTDKERFYSLREVKVTPGDDPTTVLIQVSVVNAALIPVSLSIVFSVPGAVALAGTNGKTLGLPGVGL